MKRIFRLLTLAALSVAILILSAAGSFAADKKFTVGMIIKEPSVPYIQAFVKAAEDIFNAKVPKHLKDRMMECTVEEAKAECMHFTVELCREMRKAGAPGVHFFIMNDVDIASEIITRL